MCKDLPTLRDKEYPGRLIILGRDRADRNSVIVYAITGRSPSSQARRIGITAEGAWVEPTDENMLKEGNTDLLIYPALLYGDGIAVSNGRQTSDIRDNLSPGLDPVDILSSALAHWDYEPDPPAFTPRISGCVLPDGRAAFSLIKRNTEGSTSRHYFKIPMQPGKGKMISTYSGENRDPLPSFEGDPEDIPLIYGTAAETAAAVDLALSAPEPAYDFRVAVVCLFLQDLPTAEFDISVINRSESKKNE